MMTAGCSSLLLRAVLCPLLLLFVLPAGLDQRSSLLLTPASAKTTLGRAQLTGENTENFLSKFAFSLGRGEITATFYLTEPYIEMSKALNLYVFCDEEWAQWKQLYTCVDRVKLARQTRVLELKDSGPVFESAKAMVRRNGGPADSITQAAVITTSIDHYIRTHYWYAFVADCSLEMYNHKVPPLHFNVTFLNGGTIAKGENTDNATSNDIVRRAFDHMPADERGMFALHTFNLVLLGVACAVNIFLAWQRAGDSRTVHLVVLMLLAAMGASAQSSFFELLHLMRYAQNGMGFPAFDLASALSEAFSDWIVSFILLAISCGWTLGGSSSGIGSGIGVMQFGGAGMGGSGIGGGKGGMLQSIRSTLKSPASLVMRPSLASVVLVAMFLVHLVLVIWSAVGFEDDFDKFHDHEHTPGMILMWSRVGLSVLFAVLCTRTMGRDGVGDMAQFLRLFRTAGVVWFGIMPMLVVVAKLFAQYLRHPVITGGTLTVQSCTLCIFSWLFLGSKRTLYYRKSTVGAASGGLGLSAGLDSGTKTTFRLPGTSMRTHCD